MFWNFEKNIKISDWDLAQWALHDKNRSKKYFFFKIFFDFHNKPTSDYTHAKFRQNRTIFIFRHHLGHCGPLCTSKNKNCPILTKFGVCIVWSGLVMKIKKNFEKIYFSDRFLSWSAHCARSQSEILIFFSKSQNIYMLGISKKS